MPREYSPHVAVEILEAMQEHAAHIQELAMELASLRNNPDFRTSAQMAYVKESAWSVTFQTRPLLKSAKASREAVRQAKIKRRLTIRKEVEGE